MKKKKSKEKIKTVYVEPTDEQIQRAIIEITPMKEEMESWMGCKEFTLSVIDLHAPIEDLVKYTQELRTELIPTWFGDNKKAYQFMDAYLSDVEGLLKMVRDLRLVRRREG